MRWFVLLSLVLVLAGCSTSYVPQQRIDALATLPSMERAAQLLSELENIPAGLTPSLIDSKITLISMSFELQKREDVCTQDQLNRFLVRAMELDPIANKRNGFSKCWLYLGATPNLDLARDAARDDDQELLFLILKNGLSPLPDGKISPLTYAVQNNNTQIIHALLENGFDPDGDALDRNDPWQVPLFVACRYGENPEIVQALLRAGSLASLDQAKGYAIENPKGGAIASVLISAGAEVDQHALDEALLNAFKNRKVESANRFIALGADPRRIQGKLGRVEPRGVEMVTFQNAWCKKPVAGYEPALSRAVKTYDLELARALFAAGASPNQYYTQGLMNVKVPLIWDVVSHGQTHMLKLFLFAGANPNSAWGKETLLDCLIRKMGYVDGMFASKSDDAAMKEYQSMAEDIRAVGGQARKTSGAGGFDLFMKTMTTAAVGATIMSSDIDAYHGSDIFAATVKDVWETGDGNALASLNDQYMKGDFSVKDPQLAKLLKQQQEMERQQAQAQLNLKRTQEHQRLQQQAEQQQLAAQAKQAINKRNATMLEYSRKEQESAAKPKKNQPATEPTITASQSKPSPPKKAPKPAPVARQGACTYGNITVGKAQKIEGLLSKSNLQVAGIQIAKIDVKYKIDTLFGEPVVTGTWKWTAGGADQNETLPSNLRVWLKIQNGTSYGFVKINPTIPRSGQDYAYHSSGSPNWDTFLCGFNGSEKMGSLTAEQAKAIYKGGRVVDFKLSHH